MPMALHMLQHTHLSANFRLVNPNVESSPSIDEQEQQRQLAEATHACMHAISSVEAIHIQLSDSDHTLTTHRWPRNPP